MVKQICFYKKEVYGLSNRLIKNDNDLYKLKSDCENCFGLCCVALPYAKSADFAFDKTGGTPCKNLQSDFRCGIHDRLIQSGFRGCVGYECFGAGQKVSQITYQGKDWRDNPEIAEEMFEVFPMMQQLHEMLCYLAEALSKKETQPIYKELQLAFEKTESLTNLSPSSIMELDVHLHRATVNELLLKTSELVRLKVSPKKKKQKFGRGSDLIGSKLKGADLSGANLRGALLIAADLRNSDLRYADLIGADFRDADLRGADLTGSIFLTQAQVNSAKGDKNTKLPTPLKIPEHWIG
jgi:uncharacterized protein YjbI with pentapeptide repeats